jgi:glycosyltransferase involved in cell wall biosynthesis
MRILQIANGYLDNRLYQLLFADLAGKGAEQTVFVPVSKKLSPSCEGNVHIVPCFDQLDRALFFLKQKKMLSWLEGNIPMHFDVIHAHTVFSGGYAARQLQKKYGIPYIVAVRNTDVNVFFKYMVHLRKTGLDILRNASKIIFLSPAYREQVLRDYVPLKDLEAIAAKSEVIPNGIAELFFQQDAQPKTLEGRLKLIQVGRLMKLKNPELTAKAVEILRNRGRDVELTLVGGVLDECYRPLLQKDYVNWFDNCPQEEVIGHLRAADIFVMPSHVETFGLAYVEAMSQGLPVLYTAGQGFDGQFPEGEVGYAVSDSDAEGLANSIEKVVENYEILSQNAVSGAKKFRWDTIGSRYAELYREVMG